MSERKPEKILRSYLFWIRSPDRDDCRAHLEANTLRELASVPGNLRATALFRDLGDGTTEVNIISLWASEESILGFLSKEDLLKPRIDPAVRPKLFDREPRVRQYALSDPSALTLIPSDWKSESGDRPQSHPGADAGKLPAATRG